MQVLETEDKDVKPVLKQCFETDKELIEKYHIYSGSSLNRCVDKTYSDLLKCDDLSFFTLQINDNIVGFFGKEKLANDDFLTSFFIKPEYRNGETKKQFWDIINSKFDNTFYSGIYSKNIRAQKFLEKNKGKVIKSGRIGDDNFLIYKFK